MSIEWIMAKEIYYFGCIDESGHYLHDVDGNTHTDEVRQVKKSLPFKWERLDTGFCHNPDDPTARQAEGHAKLTHEAGWTFLAFWDLSVDHRGGSHSTYMMRGTHTSEEMIAACKALFPNVWQRYKFEVRVVDTL